MFDSVLNKLLGVKAIDIISNVFNKGSSCTCYELLFLALKLLITLTLTGTRYTGPNTDLPSNSNISKTVIVNIIFTATFFKEYSISFLMICRLIDFALVVL